MFTLKKEVYTERSLHWKKFTLKEVCTERVLQCLYSDLWVYSTFAEICPLTPTSALVHLYGPTLTTASTPTSLPPVTLYANDSPATPFNAFALSELPSYISLPEVTPSHVSSVNNFDALVAEHTTTPSDTPLTTTPLSVDAPVTPVIVESRANKEKTARKISF